MAREKLFRAPPGKNDDAKTGMEAFASKLFTTPKEVIDQREAEWRDKKESDRVNRKARSKPK